MKFDETGTCAKQHADLKYGCPESEWAEGRTFKSYYDGKLNVARVCESPEAAQALRASQEAWNARHVAEYKALNLPVPPQWSKWGYEVD